MGHATETALLEILDGVYTAADVKQVTVLISLDLSAAFDTVDQEVLLQRLQSEFGVADTPLITLAPFLSGKSHAVCLAWPAPFTSRRTRCRRSSGVLTSHVCHRKQVIVCIQI